MTSPSVALGIFLSCASVDNGVTYISMSLLFSSPDVKSLDIMLMVHYIFCEELGCSWSIRGGGERLDTYFETMFFRRPLWIISSMPPPQYLRVVGFMALHSVVSIETIQITGHGSGVSTWG